MFPVTISEDLDPNIVLSPASCITLSKLLTRILRYETSKHGLSADRDGFCELDLLCSLPAVKHRFAPKHVLELLARENHRFHVKGTIVRAYHTNRPHSRLAHPKTVMPDYNMLSTRQPDTLEQPETIAFETNSPVNGPALHEMTSTCAYPTDARVRQKAAQAADPTRVVKKRKVPVEDHVDDCGNDLSGLGVDISTLLCESLPTCSFTGITDADYDSDETFLDTCPMFLFTGASCILPEHGLQLPLHAFVQFMGKLPPGIDLIELCGGEGRTTTLALRRKLTGQALTTTW